MVCLYAPGQHGWPISGTDGKKLCGQAKDDWTKDGSPGCYTMMWGETGHQGEHLNKTWDNNIRNCFRGGHAKNLEETLDKFIDKLEKIDDNQYLGNRSEGSDCSGRAYGGVCVKYTPDCIQNSWWKHLNEAIKKDKEERGKDAEQKKSEAAGKKSIEASDGFKKVPEQPKKVTQHTVTVLQPLKNEEKYNPQIAEKLLSNITVTEEKDGSPIIKPQWLLLTALLV
ncbi:unnamed protein product [Trypanosoma congolense IL3000]|uniref:WGS project CAEQ00000000 data, annotated contig 1305 n=1 Tax=Trypanosoma congolense (strain IL3000) TaxID=1068625 RepID=F9W5B8_TRYCI|nr:unnamed protein product [Trypanosoma congolense IL3000]